MKNFSMRPQEAWGAINSEIAKGLPVDAVFRMPGLYGSGVVVRVDGEPMNIFINLRSDGTWEATYFMEPLK